MYRFSPFILMATFLLLAHPLGTHAAIQSGGGFTVNGQVNAAPGAISGGGVAAKTSNHLTAQRVSGNGYALIGGIVHLNTTETATSDSASGSDADSTARSSGSGGIGGSTLILPLVNPQESTENARGTMSILDFNEIMVNWGSEICGNPGDKDGDCVVGIRDFNFLLVHWETVL